MPLRSPFRVPPSSDYDAFLAILLLIAEYCFFKLYPRKVAFGCNFWKAYDVTEDDQTLYSSTRDLRENLKGRPFRGSAKGPN